MFEALYPFALRILGRQVNLIEYTASGWEVMSLGMAVFDLPQVVGKGETIEAAIEDFARAVREASER